MNRDISGDEAAVDPGARKLTENLSRDVIERLKWMFAETHPAGIQNSATWMLVREFIDSPALATAVGAFITVRLGHKRQAGQVPGGHLEARKPVGPGEHPRDCNRGDCP